MRRSRLAVLLVLMIFLLVLNSCGKRIVVSSGEDETNDKTESTDNPTEPFITDEPENTPDEQEDKTTPEPETGTDTDSFDIDKIHPMTMVEASMAPLPLSNLNGLKINPLLQKCLDNPYEYELKEYTQGIEILNNGELIVYDRFTEKIIGKIIMGTGFQSIIEELGPCSYQETDFLVYRTSDFYLVFYGANKAEYVALIKSPVKDYDEDILYDLIAELNSSTYSILQESLDKLDPDYKFFQNRGNVNGGGYYAESLYGIYVTDFDEPIIDVMTNFEGNLYVLDSGFIRFSQSFTDFDAVVMKLKSGLYGCQNVDNLFQEEGVLSPDGKLMAVYEWVYSMSQHFIIRTLDYSIQDRYVAVQSTGEFYWLNDHVILYIDFMTNAPYAIDIDMSMPESINLLEIAGIDQNMLDSGIFDFKIVSVEDQVITIKEQNSGKSYRIQFTIDESGNIKFLMQ